ncbi:MAG: hypothetical protein LBD22_00240 [Spirochaetaceae bacterium]|jgi:DNA repair exonuclease SbcCD ATPase subunit|nr:hypothetical protein [Spirochaetaceae bacterium]
MDFFSTGNFITLIVVGAAFVVFRLTDKRNRNLQAARTYGKQLEERLKEELSQYIDKKKNDVTNYGSILAAEKSSAKAILANLQKVLGELDGRQELIDTINSRLRDYDTTLGELFRMTGRVEDNLQRIASESEFVENIAVRISGVKEKFDELLAGIKAGHENLENTVDSALNALSKEVNEGKNAIITTIAAGETEFSQTIARQRAELNVVKQDMVTALEDAKTGMDAALKNARITMDTTLQGAESNMSTVLESVQTNMDAMLQKAQSNMDTTLKSNQTEMDTALENAARTMRTTLEEEQRAFESSSDEQQKNLEAIFAGHQEKIREAEAVRAANIQRDTELITALLREAVDHAGERAGKLEDEIYAAFRAQTEERAARIKNDIDCELGELRKEAEDLREAASDINALELRVTTSITALEARVNNSLDSIDATLADHRDGVDKHIAAHRENVSSHLVSHREDIDRELEHHREGVDKHIAALKSELEGLASNAKDAALATAKEHFAAFEKAEEAFKQRMNVSMDAARSMDAEFRLQLESTQESIRKQIASFEENARALGDTVTADFENSINHIKTKLHDIESEIERIKKDAYEHTEENLRIFENSFQANLERRSEHIETRFTEWRDALNNRFATITENQEAECRRIEAAFDDGLRKKSAELDAAFMNEFERIRNAAASIEQSSREQMDHAEETLAALKEQLKNDFAELRESSLAVLSTEISRTSLESADKLKAYVREIENEQKRIAEQVDEKNNEIAERLATSCKALDESLDGFNQELKKLNVSIDEMRSKSDTAYTENEDKITVIKNSINEIHTELTHYQEKLLAGADEKSKHLEYSISSAEEKIHEFFQQSKVIDKTIEMKNELTRAMEDIRDDLQRLALQKADVDNMESQFAKIKRMEDEVNAKMTRFLTEQRRIDLMEENFRRLLQTSAAVDEKLLSLTAHDDVLRELQLQFRKLSDALQDVEEKYQRIEKKNELLDVTSEGIDKNFRSLQESEKMARQFESTIAHLSGELTQIKAAVDNLMSENAKVIETSEQLSTLDAKLIEIEHRIEDMQKARQWCAELEGRMTTLYNEAKEFAKVIGDMLKKDGVKQTDSVLTPAQREDAIRLTRMGWTPEEIARTLKIAQSAIGLIVEREMPSRAH